MKLIYLATPYTHYPDGLDAAFEDASAIAGALIKRGLTIFSPICHSHPIAKHGGIDAVDHELWMRIDREMWERCDELLVAKMSGWDQSRGIAAEIEYFLSHGKPVTYTEVESILRRDEIASYRPAGIGDVAHERTFRIGGHPPRTATEIAHADGAGEYGNPVTPGCATTPWRLP